MKEGDNFFGRSVEADDFDTRPYWTPDDWRGRSEQDHSVRPAQAGQVADA